MIASILAGETELYYGLIRPYELSVYRAALSLMKNKSDAEDVAQEAFLKALRSLDEFRGEAKFSTWLISITVNEARSRLRRQSKLRMESLDEPPRVRGRLRPALLTDWREVPSEILERRELRKMLRLCLSDLHHGVPCKYWALRKLARSPHREASIR
jgi:RNA polymerase sigma-70 factor (ECF subfamily)